MSVAASVPWPGAIATPMLGHEELARVHSERRADGLADRARQHGGGALVGVRGDDRELVAAQARELIVHPELREDALAEGAQQLIARGQADRLVDVLEAIEVEDEEGGLASRLGHGVVQAPHQTGAVRQTGEGVALAGLVVLSARLALIGRVEADGDRALHRAARVTQRSERRVERHGADLERDVHGLARQRAARVGLDLRAVGPPLGERTHHGRTRCPVEAPETAARGGREGALPIEREQEHRDLCHRRAERRAAGIPDRDVLPDPLAPVLHQPEAHGAGDDREGVDAGARRLHQRGVHRLKDAERERVEQQPDECHEEAATHAEHPAGGRCDETEDHERRLAGQGIQGDEGDRVGRYDDQDEEQSETARQDPPEDGPARGDWDRRDDHSHQVGHSKDCLPRQEGCKRVSRWVRRRR